MLAAVLAGMRHLGRAWSGERIVLVGAGAAGIGIARLLRLAMAEAGVAPDALDRSVVLVDSHGLVHSGRADLDAGKRALAMSTEALRAAGLPTEGTRPASLDAVVRAIRPTILIGTTGVAGTFTETVVRCLAEDVRPIALPLSNPTSLCEANPADILRWTDGRALVATGSPFPPVVLPSGTRDIAQANNVFVFPGLGLGAIVAEARAVTDGMLLAAARSLADTVTGERLAAGMLLPPIGDLRSIARRVAIAVATEARRAGTAGLPDDRDIAAEVDAATWWPTYVPYTRARPAPTERRRSRAG